MVHRRQLAVLVVTLLLAAHPRPVAAAPKTYTGGTGSWTDGAKWSPPGQPQSGDDVTISSGSVDLGVDTSINALTVSGGELTGSGALTVNGLLTWSSGTMSGSGTTAALAGMALGGSGKTLDQRALALNAGTAAMDSSAAAITMQNGATFTNQGVIEFSNDGGLTNSQGFFDADGTSAFVNLGTLRKLATGSSGTSRVSAGLTNSGTIEVRAGTLALGGGGMHTGATFTTTAPGVLEFSGGMHMLDAASSIAGSGTAAFGGGTTTHLGTYAVSGAMRLSGGDVVFNGTVGALSDVEIASGTVDFSSNSAQIAVGMLNQTGGTSTGSNTLVVAGPASWTSGTMSGSGTTVLMAGIDLGGTSKTLNQRTLVLSGGTATMDANVSFVSMRNGATFTNQGTFELSNDGGLTNNQGFFDGGSGSGAFNNHGTLRKLATGNSGISRFSGIAMTNTGTVEVDAASLSFSGGYTQTAGTTRLSGGTLVSTTALMINGGTLEGSGTVQADVSNSGTIAPGPSAATLQIAGAYTQTVNGTYSVEIGGPADMQFDRLAIAGVATLAGTLDVHLINAFVPSLGQSFPVMNFDSHVGTIANLTGAGIVGGLTFAPYYGLASLALQVVSASGTPTATPTLAATPSATGSTPAGSPTPTPTATPGSIAISGRVLIAGPSGLTPGQNLGVDVFACTDRRNCLADPGTPIGHAVTDSAGDFTLDVPADIVLNGTLLVVEFTVDGVVCRQVIVPADLQQSGAAQAALGDLTVDAISEAAVRLLDAAGLENYTDAAIDEVISAVRDANGTTDFSGLTQEGANAAAEQVAANDPHVQMVRQDNLLSCVGDCDGNHTVQIQELVVAVKIAVGELPVQSCKEIDANLDGSVAVNELVAAVNRTLNGCQ